MTQVPKTVRAIPQTVIVLLAAALMTVVIISALLAMGTPNLFGDPGPGANPRARSPAVLAAGREWERQRIQQMGGRP